jgi:hypothetical protein
MSEKMELLLEEMIKALREQTVVSEEHKAVSDQHFEQRKEEHAGWAVSRLNHLLDLHKRATSYYMDFLRGDYPHGDWGEVVDALAERCFLMLRDLDLPAVRPLIMEDLDRWHGREMEKRHGA